MTEAVSLRDLSLSKIDWFSVISNSFGLGNSKKELDKVIKSFEAKIANPKTPHRDKIQEALRLFKQKQDIND